jgi:hypothetical protein
MIDKVITVVHHSKNHCEDNDISNRSNRDSQGCRGCQCPHDNDDNNNNRDDNNDNGKDGRKERRRDHPKWMIEGVITGTIAVPKDARGGAPRRKADQALVTKEWARQLAVKVKEDVQQPLQHRQAYETAWGGSDRFGKKNDGSGTGGWSGNIMEQPCNNVIPLPPKKKSLSVLGLVFSPVRSRGAPDNFQGLGRKREGVDKCNNAKAAVNDAHSRGGGGKGGMIYIFDWEQQIQCQREHPTPLQ